MMCPAGDRLRAPVAGEGTGITIVSDALAHAMGLLAGRGKSAGSGLRPVGQRLALNAGNQLALIVLDFENKGIGVVWTIPLNTTQDERQGIPFGLKRGDQIGGTSIPKRVDHIARLPCESHTLYACDISEHSIRVDPGSVVPRSGEPWDLEL